MSANAHPDALPSLLHATPSLQGSAQQTGFQGLSAQAGEQPGAGHRLRLARQQRRRRAFAECQRAAAGECRLEGLRRQFDKTQREGEETRRLSLPPPRRPAPAQPGPGRGWPGPIGSSLRAVARTGSAAGRAAPGCPRDAAAAAGNAAAARRARTAPSHRRGRRCRCLPAPFRRQRSGERGRARARLRSASDPRLPRRSNRYPAHPPGNRPASAPALRAGRAADRPPRSTASGARRWPATGGAAVQDYPAGEWKRSADDAGPGAVPARVPARPGGGRQRRFPPQSRSMPANTRGTASASSPLSRRLAAQPAMGRGVLGSGEWSRASLMRHLEWGARARRWREVSRLR